MTTSIFEALANELRNLANNVDQLRDLADVIERAVPDQSVDVITSPAALAAAAGIGTMLRNVYQLKYADVPVSENLIEQAIALGIREATAPQVPTA